MISPMIDIIQEHITKVDALVTRAPVNTLSELEILLEDIRSDTIVLTNLKVSWDTHLTNT